MPANAPSPDATTAAAGGIFPLPLTPFEYYYLGDDRPEYPTAFPVLVKLQGSLDRATFEQAVRLAVARHPLLAARVDTERGWPCWVAADVEPVVDWQSNLSPVRDPRGERIDLSREPGLRSYVRTDGNSTLLRFHVHHACCDGLAGMEFAEEVLVHYCRLIGTLTEPIWPVEAARLRERTQFLDPAELPPGGIRIWLRDVGVTMRLWRPLVFRPPAALASPEKPRERTPAREDLDFESVFLGADRTRALREAAKRAGVSLNDLLMRDVLRAAADWNRALGEGANRQLRVLMPVDLRSRLDRTMPATNRMSFAFVTHTWADGDDPEALLRDTAEQIRQIRDYKLGLYFLGGLGFAAGLRGAIPWFLKRKRPFATLCLSNLGRVFGRSPLPRKDGKFVIGTATLESLTGVPPIRPFTRASLAIFLYDQQLSIALRCDPRHFTPQQARDFLELYVARLTESTRTG